MELLNTALSLFENILVRSLSLGNKPYYYYYYYYKKWSFNHKFSTTPRSDVGETKYAIQVHTNKPSLRAQLAQELKIV